MKIVIFGLSISSSWGNGHATLWRGLCKALARQRHTVVFFERDVPYYASTRDYHELPSGRLVLYPDWECVRERARAELRDADAAIITSYCADGIAATALLLSCPAEVNAFYDLDTPVTLSRLASGERLPYIGPRGLRDFDLVLSYTGGAALEALRSRLAARHVVPLYGHADPEQHRAASSQPHYRADLSYLGTYSSDRQAGLDTLFVRPAQSRPKQRFLIAGAQYPEDFPWAPNVYFVQHLPPSEHPGFFCSSRLTLNVTRASMAEMGWCPSGRLFEASACGTPLLTDTWDGLDHFFTPGAEIISAHCQHDVLDALDCDDAELARIGRAARDRTLTEHTSERRADQLITALRDARSVATMRKSVEA